ncbi:SPFH domain-containing protein [Chloroflexus sp.]|uniref:SPFH domain-containing protein n=1 Tax=Chloroflexus sp. TaxID=1904827 RepID=UPI00298F3924|nr:SPFH domain-containing protein [Chloroflexus sp.]MCS6887191.1 SPFH domain-containing protein [Chloroflexus sp.]MDW8404427.1 SPFH domain-containing protein [Chloroflexus sp.]
MSFLISTITVALTTFVAAFIVVPMFFGLLRLFGIYTIVHEGTCKVYTLFGNVVGVFREPGLVILPFHLGANAFLVNFFGDCKVIDMRLDQRYLRSQPVNSEEGAPMGIGVWYEMAIVDPVAYLFKNVDPQGSLAANVSNAVVRTLSNMPLAQMLENRHAMSQAVRAEVSPKAAEWGYRLGSVYIRKVHFRDINMIRQIEAKVVNRLRQVTSAILQDGANRVNIITSTAERQAAIEFARAKAVRPQILGQALAKISTDPEVRDALFTILELQNLAESKARVTLVPSQTDSRIMPALMAAQDGR